MKKIKLFDKVNVYQNGLGNTEKYIEWFNRISNLENLICFCDDQTLPKIKENIQTT